MTEGLRDRFDEVYDELYRELGKDKAFAPSILAAVFSVDRVIEIEQAKGASKEGVERDRRTGIVEFIRNLPVDRSLMEGPIHSNAKLEKIVELAISACEAKEAYEAHGK